MSLRNSFNKKMEIELNLEGGKVLIRRIGLGGKQATSQRKYCLFQAVMNLTMGLNPVIFKFFQFLLISYFKCIHFPSSYKIIQYSLHTHTHTHYIYIQCNISVFKLVKCDKGKLNLEFQVIREKCNISKCSH